MLEAVPQLANRLALPAELGEVVVCHIQGDEGFCSEAMVLDEAGPVAASRFTFGNGPDWVELGACPQG